MSGPRVNLEEALRDLPRLGTLIKDRGYRQVWRFEHGGRAYFLKFYPRHGSRDRWRRLFRGSPAMREFFRLQWLQKASVPAPRVVSVLLGLRVKDCEGDAVILEAIEPAVQLDQYLNDLQLRGERAPDHLQLSEQVRTIVYGLGKAKLGHEDLHLGNFLLHGGKIYLLDAYAVRPGGLRRDDVLRLGQSAARFGTVTDLRRGWELLSEGDAKLPDKLNPVAESVRRTFLSRVTAEDRYFGRLSVGGWGGVFFKHAKYPKRWSAVSRMEVRHEDWAQAWPELLGQIEADRLQVLKRSRSGDVLAGEVTLGGTRVPIVIKRPRRRYWYRYLNEIGRGARARRAWRKAWSLIIRNLPTAWPVLLMEKRKFGYVTDTLVVFERVPGPTLAAVELEKIEPRARDMLFRRAGRILRQIEQFGFAHFDAKASNWIVMPDDKAGPTPVLIDVDGVRRRRWTALGTLRLLKSMRKHPRYTPADSLALCQGYAPYSRFVVEEEGADDGASSKGGEEESDSMSEIERERDRESEDEVRSESAALRAGGETGEAGTVNAQAPAPRGPVGSSGGHDALRHGSGSPEDVKAPHPSPG